VKAGTVEIEQVQVAFIGSGNVGGGTLGFQGKSYASGSAGWAWAASASPRCRRRRGLQPEGASPVPRRLWQARYGFAAADKSGGEMWLQNPNGVLISLRAKRTGLALSLGADAVYIDFK